MPRSILFVDTYYFALLRELGMEAVPHEHARYSETLNEVLEFGFGTGGAYTRAFRELGWDAGIVVPNSLTLQTLWAREHGRRDPWRAGWAYGAHLARLPIARSLLGRLPHVHGTLLKQVQAMRPDVLYVQDLNLVPLSLAKALRRHTRLLIGEIASPLPPRPYLMGYDLIVSALPSIVDTARSWGIAAENVPLGFDERWATMTPASERPIDAIFIGSFSRLQPQTWPLLQAVARAVPGLAIYGPADPRALAESGLAEHYAGTAWGRDMFELLGRSKVVVNRHGSVAGRYAANMRMYEATGSGAALLTEQRENLGDLFSLDEVVAYTSIKDAAEKAASLVADPQRLDAVAAAGQRRTLRTHSYRTRAQQVAELIQQQLS